MSQHHDPVHPDSDHLTAEVLADLDLGLLDEASAEHAGQHLQACEHCAALHDDLATLTESLSALQLEVTEPMPDEVWDQVSAALASEPVLTPEGSATVVPLESSRKRRLAMPGIGLVAGLAVVAFVGAIVVGNLQSDDGANTASESSSGDADSAGPPSAADYEATRSGTHYKQDEISAQVTQLVAARSSTFDAAQSDGDQAVGGTVSANPSASASATVSPGPQGTQESTPKSGSEQDVKELLRTAAPMATNPAAAQACLAGYLHAPDIAPLAIDIGLWQGKPAAVIVLPIEGDPSHVEVWVIDPGCTPTGTSDPTYFFATVDR